MTRTRFALLPITLLAACGGGGGAPQTPAATPDVAITEDNAAAVAGAAYEAAYMPARLARIAVGFLEVAPPTPPAGTNPGIVTQVVAGPDGGEATVSWSDADRDGGYTTGDAFTIEFDAYAANGLTLAGTATIEGLVVDGDPLVSLTWIADGELSLLDLAYDAGDGTQAATGRFAFHREERSTTQILSLEALGDAEVGLRKVGARSTSGRNEYVLDFQQGFYGDGDFVDPVAGGTFAFATLRTMTGLQFLFDPGFGELRVLGAGGSSVTIVPVDFFNVELRVDANGDGAVDATIASEWATL